MARPLRVEFVDAIYHVCSRGNARQRIFWDDRDRNRFIELDPINASARATSQLRNEMLNVEI